MAKFYSEDFRTPLLSDRSPPKVIGQGLGQARAAGSRGRSGAVLAQYWLAAERTLSVNPHAGAQVGEIVVGDRGGGGDGDMRRFVPGVDSYLGPGVPALLQFTGPEFGEMALIQEHATTLSDRFRQLCYWRQVVNAENN